MVACECQSSATCDAAFNPRARAPDSGRAMRGSITTRAAATIAKMRHVSLSSIPRPSSASDTGARATGCAQRPEASGVAAGSRAGADTMANFVGRGLVACGATNAAPGHQHSARHNSKIGPRAGAPITPGKNSHSVARCHFATASRAMGAKISRRTGRLA